MSDQGMRLFAVFLGFPVLLLAYRCQSPNQDHQMVTSSKSNSVSLFLPSQPSSDVFHMVWKKDNKVMAKAKNISNVLTFRNKTILFPNGTLLLYSLLKEDRGLFQLEIFSDSGTCLFWGSIMLDVQDPVSKPVLSQISWQNETVNLKCEVQRGDNVSIQWLERPCGTNSSWVRTMRGFTLSVERGTSREFICTAMNNISQETSNALTVDCHDGAAPEIVSNSGDEPMRRGVMETKVGSFAVRDQQVLQMLKEEVYVDMSLETIARTVPEMSSFGPMEAPWNAQEAETDAIYVPMNTANSKEETVPASEISQPATQPSGEEQVSDVSSGNDRRQVVYAEVNFSSKEQSKCSSSPTVGQSQ
ncbi:uncharacterized protein LOC108923048 isoform X2 [Scleropages formosus]|uniref:uncharacterized protein LOC108923048 isoform X2 n=1 Tax=Scleropages formosus TaxID=113540 RepID=UPI0010FA80A4|nr:uncharacterized protein LOC108923048 isoform X2 [Scleropages formosus]